jgi:DNA-directed RNA polymerase specialized sigma24 family protein
VNSKAYQVVSQIPDGEWRGIALDLERYALSVSRSLRWRTRNPVELPGGETVTSIVSKAIEKLFSGDRDWNPEQDPDIRKYLQGVIDSLLNHLAESQDNILVTVAPEPESAVYRSWETGSRQRDPAADWLVPPDRSPEAALVQQEREALEDRALGALLDECAEDTVLMAVLESMMDGERPAEISTHKGIPVKDVYNAVKRLDRKLEIVRKHFADEGGSVEGGSVSEKEGL